MDVTLLGRREVLARLTTKSCWEDEANGLRRVRVAVRACLPSGCEVGVMDPRVAAVGGGADGGQGSEVRGQKAPPEEAGAEVSGEAVADGRHVFRHLGSHWEVVFDGGARFTLPDTLGAAYIDHLLHHPNTVIPAHELEKLMRVEKEQARGAGTKQEALDEQAKAEVDAEVARLEKDLAAAREAGNDAGAKRIEREIQELRRAGTGTAGMSAEMEERARNNVRKAITAVLERLRKGNKAQKAFGQHLGQYLDLGYEVVYNQPQGGIWK